MRIALGAQPGDVLKLVVGNGMKLAFIGAALGLIAASGLTRWLKSLLFGISATDPLTLAAVTATLLAVAFAACRVPARRAMKVDPMIARRQE